MQYYVVTFTHTKLVRWAIFLPAHIRYLKKMIADGKLQISGPGVGTPVRSAQLVFNVTDREELDKLVAGDPYSKHASSPQRRKISGTFSGAAWRRRIRRIRRERNISVQSIS